MPAQSTGKFDVSRSPVKEHQMKHPRRPLLCALAFALLSGLCSAAHAHGAGVEWDTLNREVMELCCEGGYDRAVRIRTAYC